MADNPRPIESATEKSRYVAPGLAPESYASGVGPTWTEERVAQLRKRWLEDGASAGVIAAEMRLTRNAVIGKVHRLDLHRKTRVSLRPIGRQPVVALNYGRRRRYVPVVVEEAPAAPNSEPKFAAYDLGPQDCRFPSGHPGSSDFFYCGSPKMPGSSYCQHHHRIAYREAPRLSH